MIIYLDRLRRQTAAAIATAPKWVVHSCLALLLELISSDAFSIVKYNMLSLFVFRRLLGSLFKQRGEASVSTSFRINSVISFWTEEFFYAAWAICLYAPRTSILPGDSESCGSFLLASFDGHWTLTDTSTFFAMVSVTLASVHQILFKFNRIFNRIFNSCLMTKGR